MQDEFGIEGIVRIGNDLYAKSPEALSQLLERLKKDYEIEDCSKDEYHPSPGHWFASVRGSTEGIFYFRFVVI